MTTEAARSSSPPPAAGSPACPRRLALPAALLSIPLGIGLYLALYQAASGNTTDAVLTPWQWLALIPVATLLLVVAATGLPARLATRIRTADALRFD
jgi:ABC-type antimicrobial peptide transport system permease subunit